MITIISITVTISICYRYLFHHSQHCQLQLRYYFVVILCAVCTLMVSSCLQLRGGIPAACGWS
jgi:hypothetical protein